MQRNRGASPRRMMAPPRRCQNIKCPCTGTGVRVWSALERGGASSRVERTLERGGACSRQAHPLERGGARLREACVLERGGACSRGSLSGPPWWAVRATVRGPCPVCLSEARLAFAGFKWGFPSCLRGPLGLSPTVAPEHLRVRHQGSRRCWSLLIGRASLLACERFPWGRVSGPAGLAPKDLQERGRSCRGLSRDLVRGRGTCFSRRRQCFSQLR
jgi:hypothetical protein